MVFPYNDNGKRWDMICFFPIIFHFEPDPLVAETIPGDGRSGIFLAPKR